MKEFKEINYEIESEIGSLNSSIVELKKKQQKLARKFIQESFNNGVEIFYRGYKVLKLEKGKKMVFNKNEYKDTLLELEWILSSLTIDNKIFMRMR